jgi:hypothetical protein
MTSHDVATFFAGCALTIIVLWPLSLWYLASTLKRTINMQIADLVSALEAITTQLQPVPGEITAAIAAGDATALATIDAPVAALQAAVAAVVAAVPHA